MLSSIGWESTSGVHSYILQICHMRLKLEFNNVHSIIWQVTQHICEGVVLQWGYTDR